MDAHPQVALHQPGRLLRLIALFKFCKATLLVVVGLGAFELLRPDIAAHAQHWVEALAASSDRRAVQRLISLVTGLSPWRLEVLGIGASLYAALFTVEGVGLWRAKRWAEYLTVVASLLFVPLEVFEVMRRVSPARLAALVINLAVAVYLIYRLRRSGAAAQQTLEAAGRSQVERNGVASQPSSIRRSAGTERRYRAGEE
jgi:uncharacterized membrane protein (DUF2068 family)